MGIRRDEEMSGGGIGLHWDDLDEDVSVPHLLVGQDIEKVV